MDGVRNNGTSAHSSARFVHMDVTFDVWRAKLGLAARKRIVNKIVDTLRRYIHASGHVLRTPKPELSWEPLKMAARFEEKMFITAKSKDDYLRRIFLKMFIMDVKAKNASATNQTIKGQQHGKLAEFS